MGRIHRQPTSARTESPPLQRRGAIRRGALFGAGMLLGLTVGPALGLVSPEPAGPPRVGRANAPAIAAAASQIVVPAAEAPAEAEAPPVGDLFAQWLRDVEAARLDALARTISSAGLELVAGGVIDRLEGETLERLVIGATDFEHEDLAEIENLPAFTRELTRIAMDGTVRDAEAPDDRVRPIDFAEEVTWDHRAAFAQSQFGADVPRIYAVFESDGLGADRTLAKWTRVADGEILLFARHRIRPAADSSYVYLDAPPAGWRSGEYRVDFYRADESLAWLASGTHRITR